MTNTDISERNSKALRIDQVELRSKSLIRFYFGEVEDCKKAAVSRAYLDLCRTLKKKPGVTQEERDSKRLEAEMWLHDTLTQWIEREFKSQSSVSI